MIRDAHSTSGTTAKDEGKVSLDDFKRVARAGSKLSTSSLWSSVRGQSLLSKGGKAVLRKLEDLEQRGLFSNGPKDERAEAVAMEEIEEARVWEFDEEERNAALRQAGAGLGILVVLALLRKIAFKI